MTSRKNVVFIGMTQNGKSSLIQQVLLYAGELEKASTIGIGHGNFSETQNCSVYDVQLPLKTHRLRQIQGPDEEKNGDFVEPGVDFKLKDVDDFTFAEDVKESGEQLQLRLIDTPGLSDSGNSEHSRSGMRVVDERHKLRILLALQNVEDLHAVCFVVRRDTNYGGDFQSLVKRLVSLLDFCNPTNPWNLQYHIIHTNIDVDDRDTDLCRIRQQSFDDFGPAGAVHYFLDNKPDPDFPLDIFFTNRALSNLFNSLVPSTPVKFSDLRYPKSRELIDTDRRLLSAARTAIAELQDMVKESGEEIDILTLELNQHETSMILNQKRINTYDEKIAELDRDDLSEIGSQEGWTEVNIVGNGARHFSMHSDIPIASVNTSCGGGGHWTGMNQQQHHYQVVLQPYWCQAAHGTVTLYARKREKRSMEISGLRADRLLVIPRLEKFQLNFANVSQCVTTKKHELAVLERQIATLEQDALTMQNCGKSVSLSQNKETIKFLSADSPLAAAKAYNLTAVVPWTIPVLKNFPRAEIKAKIEAAVTDARKAKEGAVGNGERSVHLEHGAQAMMGCLGADEGLSVGAFATWLKARESEDPLLSLLGEFVGMSELAEVALDE